MAGIIATARGLIALLHPLTGTRATGTVLAAATGADTEIPKGSYCYPVVGDQLTPHLLLKTTADTTVASGGTSVPITSNIGGLRHNLATATEVRWNPGLTGIEPTAEVEAPGLTGGADLAATVPVRILDAQFYEQIRNPGELFRARGVGRFPAVVLGWVSGARADGDANARLGRSGVAMAGKRDVLWQHQWQLLLIVSKSDSAESRRDAGLDLLDNVAGLLSNRMGVDGEVVSTPSGIKFLGMQRARLGPEATSYIYAITLQTTGTVSQIDSRTFSTWATTNIDATLPAAGDQVDPLLLVDDVEVSMS